LSYTFTDSHSQLGTIKEKKKKKKVEGLLLTVREIAEEAEMLEAKEEDLCVFFKKDLCS
jgi:hypothetical protein